MQLSERTISPKKTGQCSRSNLRANSPSDRRLPESKSLRRPGEYLFAGERGNAHYLTTRQYARLVSAWIGNIRLQFVVVQNHSLRRTKATLIYRRTGDLRAVQLLLGHTKIESPVRYLGIEVDDALAISEQVDV